MDASSEKLTVEEQFVVQRELQTTLQDHLLTRQFSMLPCPFRPELHDCWVEEWASWKWEDLYRYRWLGHTSVLSPEEMRLLLGSALTWGNRWWNLWYVFITVSDNLLGWRPFSTYAPITSSFANEFSWWTLRSGSRRVWHFWQAMIDKIYEEEQEADVIHAGCNYVSVSVTGPKPWHYGRLAGRTGLLEDTRPFWRFCYVSWIATLRV